MNERALILEAIQKKDAFADKHLPQMDQDVIEKTVKRMKKRERFRSKPVLGWNNVDFLNYIQTTLKEFGVVFLGGNHRRDSDILNRVHDSLAHRLKSEMSNDILKEYVDWWMSHYAPRLTTEGFQIYGMLSEDKISRFAKRYTRNTSSPSFIVHKEMDQPCDEYTLYDSSGLAMSLSLVMFRGVCLTLVRLKSSLDLRRKFRLNPPLMK